MAGVFICYRREDAAGIAGRLYDRLVQTFGGDMVFKDVDSLAPGADYVETIDETLGKIEVLIALIGPEWLTASDGRNRRLDDPNDLLRLEIARALQRDVRVVPMLVRRATMPAADDLPDDLKPLANRHAFELSETRFHRDVDDLIESISPLLRADPLALVLTTEDRADQIWVTSKPRRGLRGQVQVCLTVQGSGWWKGLGLNTREPVIEGEQRDGVSCTTITPAPITITFWKAKALGVHTQVGARAVDLSDYADHQIDFVWTRD